MTGADYAVPAALRSARFVPRERSGHREPLRVTPAAFTAAGLPVPDDPRRMNAYRLSRQQGWAWSPAIDRLTRCRGSEIQPGGYVCVDCDVHLAVDGTAWIDGLRWLAGAAVGAGEILDITTCVAVRTPGHPQRGHGPGWHLWFRDDPGRPVRTGTLTRCAAVEIKTRCTAPGSPGYTVRQAPDDLPLLPSWIADLAGPPPQPATAWQGTGSARWTWQRLHGVIERLLGAGHGERNTVLFWASCRAGEAVASGLLTSEASRRALLTAAGVLGLVHEDGEQAVMDTINNGLGSGA